MKFDKFTNLSPRKKAQILSVRRLFRASKAAYLVALAAAWALRRHHAVTAVSKSAPEIVPKFLVKIIVMAF